VWTGCGHLASSQSLVLLYINIVYQIISNSLDKALEVFQLNVFIVANILNIKVKPTNKHIRSTVTSLFCTKYFL